MLLEERGSLIHDFYTNEEFQRWLNKKSINVDKWSIEYKKGLAALEDDEYEKIIKEPNVVKLTLDEMAKDSLESWFGKDSSPRKIKLL